MDERVDAQELAIGAGTVIAFTILAYGLVVGDSMFGVDTTALATWVLAATFVAVALLHGAYGRRDLALAHAVAAVGLVLVLLEAGGPQVVVGLVLLVAGGSYVAVVTIRARRETPDAAG